MTDGYVVDFPGVTTLPVVGSDRRFPVGRIFCVGRNYSEHIREMGGDPNRETPFFFMKPADAIVPPGGVSPYPPATSDMHHEVELVLAIGREGLNVSVADAESYVYGVGIGIDLTRRDLQTALRNIGRPWEGGKAFDYSAPCSAIKPLNGAALLETGSIELSVNGQKRQNSDLANMTWSPTEVIAELTKLFRIRPGDLIYTGTPEGVGPVVKGDHLTGSIANVGTIDVRIT